jgi:putative DNA primase/helicase
MTEAEGANQPVAADSRMIASFAKVLFDYSEGWVAVRAFPEKGDASQPARTPFVAADAELPTKLVAEAEAAAKKGLALYVVAGTVSGPGKAKAGDVIAIETVLVDLDHGDVSAKREHLVKHLGPPSLEVASGGVTAEGQERLHLYWKLNEPATGADIAKVCDLRGVIATKVGGDPSFRSAHQPIRVAGSVYRKRGMERLVIIRTKRAAEYDLIEFADRVGAMPSLFAEHLHAGGNKPSVIDLFAHQVREGGVDGVTRFALSRIIGYWIRRFRDGHVTREQAWGEIVAYNEARIDPPWPVDKLRHEAERLWQRDEANHTNSNNDAEGSNPSGGGGDSELAPVRFSEDALAATFTAEHAENWRFVAGWGQWLVWTGTRWEREGTLRAYDLARIVCRTMAATCPIGKLRAKLSSAATVAAVERLARADRRHASTTEVWDRDQWLLNTPGGVIDLLTGALKPHDRALAMTKITSATPQGDCAKWRQFLVTVTGGDAELQAYLKRVAGYCLTGITSEHALFFVYGTGANGKSVFANTLTAVVGDYATVAAMDMFMAASGERHPTDMAGLRGSRVVTSIETEQGRRWAESS